MIVFLSFFLVIPHVDNIVYEVVYYPALLESDAHTITVSHNADQLEALIDDLEFEADYEVKIRAGNDFVGEWSEDVIALVTTGIQGTVNKN